MPRQGQSVESCIIGMWHKKKGDRVSIGDILFTYETDKSTFEEEAKAEGVLLEIFYGEGDEVLCLETVCLIGEEGESVEGFARPPVSPPPTSEKEACAPHPALISPFASQTSDRAASEKCAPQPVFISPRARALAEKSGADISRAQPTGAGGRIIERDIIKVISEGYLVTQAAREGLSGAAQDNSGYTETRASQERPGVELRGEQSPGGTGIGGRVTTYDLTADRVLPPAAEAGDRKAGDHQAYGSGPAVPDFEETKLTTVRKAIAKAMHSSLSDGAQLTLQSSFDATDIFSFRKNLKALEGFEELAKITVTDIITFAVSRMLPKHRSINAHILGDSMRLYNNAHIGVAVDTHRGLLVPTVFNANSLSLSELSARAKALFEKCRQGSIEPDALKGGTFTISNLGGLGIEMFTPVLNPPQTGLLGVCCVTERLKEGKPYPAMGLSLTFDHRALDGADAARFLKDLVSYLEKFSVFVALEGGSI